MIDGGWLALARSMQDKDYDLHFGDQQDSSELPPPTREQYVL